jgi:hypothetical protein
MKTFVVLFALLSVWVLPPYEEEISSVQVKNWTEGQEIHGSTVGAEAVFQLPGRMLEIQVEGCDVIVNNQVVTLDPTGFVDTNPDGSNPTFLDTKDRIVCEDGGSFVAKPYFQE